MGERIYNVNDLRKLLRHERCIGAEVEVHAVAQGEPLRFPIPTTRANGVFIGLYKHMGVSARTEAKGSDNFIVVVSDRRSSTGQERILSGNVTDARAGGFSLQTDDPEPLHLILGTGVAQPDPGQTVMVRVTIIHGIYVVNRLEVL
jgi:hypothetical protein